MNNDKDDIWTSKMKSAAMADAQKVVDLTYALTDLLGQMQQGAYYKMIEHSPSAQEAIANAEAALGLEPGSSYPSQRHQKEKG